MKYFCVINTAGTMDRIRYCYYDFVVGNKREPSHDSAFIEDKNDIK